VSLEDCLLGWHFLVSVRVRYYIMSGFWSSFRGFTFFVLLFWVAFLGRYGCFFCTFTMQMGACIFFAIGPPGTGSSGIWTASIATQENKEVSFLMWAAAVLWVLLSIANIVGVQKVLITFRTSGMAENAVERAQKEAAAGAGQVAFQAAQTPAGRDIAVSAAMGAYGSNA
jgi:hypothetical protein